MIGKTSVFVICVEAIIYLLLYNLHALPLRVIFNLQFSQELVKICSGLRRVCRTIPSIYDKAFLRKLLTAFRRNPVEYL